MHTHLLMGLGHTHSQGGLPLASAVLCPVKADSLLLDLYACSIKHRERARRLLRPPSPHLCPDRCKKSSGTYAGCSGETVVTYFFCGEEIPYRRTMKSHSLTLSHFKEQLRKKGNYRYRFQSSSNVDTWRSVFFFFLQWRKIRKDQTGKTNFKQVS